MEQNTVVLKVERYDELKEKERVLNASNFICFKPFRQQYYVVGKEEIIDTLKEKIIDLEEEINLLKTPKDKTKSIKDLEQMNLLSLIKWKLSRNK